MSEDNLYETLQVSSRAEDEVISAAYRALAKKYHPDIARDGDSRIKNLNEAHEILSDPARRWEYDKNRNATMLDGKILGDRYRILERIATGGFGSTYKAEHVILGDLVCVKHRPQISMEAEKVLIEETKAIWDLRHFAIPAVRDLFRLDDGTLALVMSYIPGPTLEQVVNKAGCIDAENVAWITERILNALKYLHYNAVVHGDLKPQNIILQPESHSLTLVDYGMSSIKPTDNSTSKGFTDYFSPPEEVSGHTLLPESDFYGLGMTMIYMLGGGYDHVKRREVPVNLPGPMIDFIKRLIVRDVLARPNWGKEDLFETIKKIRFESFGREHSDMKTIPGF